MSLEATEPAEDDAPATRGQHEPAAPPDEPAGPGAVELPEAVEPVELIGLAEPVEPDEPAHRHRGLLLAAAFTIAALVIVGGAIGVVGALTHGFRKPVTVKYRESAVFKLQAGDCVNTPDGQVVSVLPCSTPHQAEVFAAFSLPGSAWPGTTAVEAAASSGCASRLAGYLNPQLAVSLAQAYVFPDKVAWTAGTRTVICEVRATSGQLTGSVRGASLAWLTRPGSFSPRAAGTMLAAPHGRTNSPGWHLSRE
jgi:Septum formation